MSETNTKATKKNDAPKYRPKTATKSEPIEETKEVQPRQSNRGRGRGGRGGQDHQNKDHNKGENNQKRRNNENVDKDSWVYKFHNH